MLSNSLIALKSYSWYRIVLTPILGIVSLFFFLLLWVKPFMFHGPQWYEAPVTGIGRYFFILFILTCTFTLSNIERGSSLSRQRCVRMIFASAILFLAPYLLLAIFSALFLAFNLQVLLYSSFSVCLGAAQLLATTRHGIQIAKLKEDTAVNASLTLFLIGGYLFFIGAFIKLFQLFGWSLSTLFSFLTTGFVIFVIFFLVASSSTIQRVKLFFLRYLTRQKFDWQKVWEEFTYKISLDTQVDTIKQHVQEFIGTLMNGAKVEVELFDKGVPFEQDFADWVLRRAEAFSIEETFANGFVERYPLAHRFFIDRTCSLAAPLYGDKKIIGLICFCDSSKGSAAPFTSFVDKELLRVLCMQASGAILNCIAYQRLHDAEKKESLYKLSSFVIHDVKNYVYNISLLISNKDKFSNPKFQADALFTLETTVDKMQKLIDEFRALRGDLVLHKETHSVKGLVNEVLQDLGKGRFENVSVRLEAEDSLTVYADPQYLYKVILNLITNALEAMGNNGILRVAGFTDEGAVVIKVTDNGKGMSADFIDTKLFRPFSSTKQKGMGIGSYQCKTIIEAHGGTITAGSKEGVETEFSVRLPVK